MSAQRYYFHGDSQTDLADHYFCVRCDFFVRQEHFQTEHSKEDRFRSYLRSRRWLAGKIRNGSTQRRPKKAPNIFDGEGE